MPRALPRLVPLPGGEGCCDFIMLHELIESQVEQMFRGYEVLSRSAFRVTRNSNLYMQEEESRSVLDVQIDLIVSYSWYLQWLGYSRFSLRYYFRAAP